MKQRLPTCVPDNWLVNFSAATGTITDGSGMSVACQIPAACCFAAHEKTPDARQRTGSVVCKGWRH